MRAAAVQAMNLARLELPAYDGLEFAHEISSAGLHQQPRRINFKVLPFHVKRGAVRSHPVVRPFAAGPQIVVTVKDLENAFLPPPLRQLLGISDCFEDASWRSRSEDFR